GLGADNVTSVYTDERGVKWVTTAGGLSRIQGGRVTTFGAAAGLLDETLHWVLPDDEGGLWMSCNRGIFRMSRDDLDAIARGTLQRAEALELQATDGMRGAECNSAGMPAGFRGREGRLWFPCIRGAV